jgi:hypothetical protein
MNIETLSTEHAELLLLPDGRILAHSITPELAAILSGIDPHNRDMAQRAVPKEADATPAGN